MRQHFEQSENRELLGVPPHIHAGGLHCFATDTGEFCLWIFLPQPVDQGGPELVA